MGRIRKDAYDLEFLPESSNVKFTGPKRIGFFSTYIDKEYKDVYCPDNSSQRYLDSNELNKPIDCLEGFDPEIDQCMLPGSWSSLFQWIISNKTTIDGLPSNGSDPPFDFVCSNMELKEIMLSAYSSNRWLVHAIKNRNSIFLFTGTSNGIKMESRPEVEKTDELGDEKQEEEEEEEKSELVEGDSYTDYNNKLNCARFNVIRAITKRVQERELNSNTEMDIFSVVSFSKIGQHRILHTGFTEFVMSKDDVDKPIDQVNFTALKLMHKLFRGGSPGFNISFYRKMYWWASALVTGVETLVCGDLENFNVKEFRIVPVSDLNITRKQAAQKKSFITLDKILDFIKSQVKESDMIYDFHLDVETKEVIVSPPKSIDLLSDTNFFWYLAGDTPK